MPKSRKTTSVSELTDKVNKRLALSDDVLNKYILRNAGSPERAYRLALAGLLEGVLMETNNYHGFGYQEGVFDFTADPPEQVGDDTRRIYYS
jgi:hypothetical protein